MKASTYTSYMSAGGTALCVLVLLLFGAAQSCLIATDFMIKNWALKNATEQEDEQYPRDYAIVCCVAVVVLLVRSVLFFTATIQAATGE